MSPIDTAPVPRLVELSAAELRGRLPDALAIYVEAMGYPRGTDVHRAPMWTEHTTRPGWRGVAAFLPRTGTDAGPAETMVGIAYGYRGSPRQWWQQQVREGMRRSGATPEAIEAVLGDYFELTELHVSPAAQGHGIGDGLLRALLTGRPESGVLLSTPEVPDEANRAWRLYRRLGFTDLVRHFRFTGDNRPFAVLARPLPL